jgi:alkylated DNA nucleotide flippase Atl1
MRPAAVRFYPCGLPRHRTDARRVGWLLQRLTTAFALPTDRIVTGDPRDDP